MSADWRKFIAIRGRAALVPIIVGVARRETRLKRETDSAGGIEMILVPGARRQRRGQRWGIVVVLFEGDGRRPDFAEQAKDAAAGADIFAHPIGRRVRGFCAAARHHKGGGVIARGRAFDAACGIEIRVRQLIEKIGLIERVLQIGG